MKYRFILLLPLAVALTACNRHRDSASTTRTDAFAVPVRTQVVQAGQRPAFEEIAGTVRARLRARVEAKVSGRIELLPAVPGQSVKSGELLARLEVREIRARLDQAVAQRDQAERDLRRFTTLVEQGAVTRQEFDVIQTRDRIARAAVAEAEAMLGYASVTAPFDGVITRKLADVGDLAAPGKPLVELEETTDLRLEADVPEALLDRIALDLKLPVRLDAVERPLEGTVVEIAPAADPSSRTFLVKLELPPVAGLRTGQFGRVSVPVAEQEAVWVPRSALSRRGQLDLAFVVTNDCVQLRLVRTGRRAGSEVELVSGLTPGERVALDAPANLLEGQRVKVRP